MKGTPHEPSMIVSLTPLENQREGSALVIATRGKCTYTQKARNAQHASASALLIVNNEEGLLHPPGPDGKDLGEPPKSPLFLLRYIYLPVVNVTLVVEL